MVRPLQEPTEGPGRGASRPGRARSRRSSLHEEIRRLAASLLGETGAGRPGRRAGRRSGVERNRSRTGGRRRRNRPRDRQSSDSSAEHGSQDEPAYEVLESDDAYILGLHVPGHDRRHLTVEVTDDTLTVTGEEAAPPVRVREHASDEAPDPREETRSETEEKGPDRQRPDRGGGDAFESRFEISGEVADEELSAAYRDGILAIRIPKHALSTPGRRIEITFPED